MFVKPEYLNAYSPILVVLPLSITTEVNCVAEANAYVPIAGIDAGIVMLVKPEFANATWPILVVLPLSVLGNWEREFTKFCPKLRILMLHGAKDERAQQREALMTARHYDVCLTTKETVSAEIAALKKVRWGCLVIDEAHCLSEWGQSPCQQYEGHPASWQQVQGAETCEWSATQVDIGHTGTSRQKTRCYLCQSGRRIGLQTC